jgi:hypothetical protein
VLPPNWMVQRLCQSSVLTYKCDISVSSDSVT